MWFLLARLVRKRKQAERQQASNQQATPADDSATENHWQEVGEGKGAQPATSSAGSTVWFKIRLWAALLLPVLLETLDYTVVATAQPRIASAFNALSLQSYVGAAYLLSSTAFLPLFASLADVFGRHPALQLSLVFFLIGSTISTGAINMAMMLIGRGIAGVGAAGLLSIVRTILLDSRSLDDNNWQTSILFLLYAISYAVGPLIGGYLVAVSFRWVFAINLPICVLSIIICFLLLRRKIEGGQPSTGLAENPARKNGFLQQLLRIDWIGTFLFIAGVVLLLLALNWGSTDSWSSVRVVVCWVLGLLLIIACLLWEYVLERQSLRIHPSSHVMLNCDPMIPLEIFRSYNVCAIMYGCFVSGMVMLVMFYFISIFMTIVAGKSPAAAGVQLVHFAPGVGAGTLISIRLISKRRQPKYPIILGSLILPTSLGLVEWAIGNNNQSQVNGFLVLAGSGVGLTAGPLAIQARFSLPSRRVAVVSSMNLFFRSLGGTVGLAQCSTVMNAKVDRYLKNLVASGQLTGPAADDVTSTNANRLIGSVDGVSDLPPDVRTAVRNAFQYGLQWSFISLIPWAGLAFFVVSFLSKITDQDRAREEEMTKLERETHQRELEKDDGESQPAQK